jgi:hypothetical protein
MTCEILTKLAEAMNEPSKDNFWKPKAIQELAQQQGIEGPQSLEKITGVASELWESDEDFENFLQSIDRHRREAASA